MGLERHTAARRDTHEPQPVRGHGPLQRLRSEQSQSTTTVTVATAATGPMRAARTSGRPRPIRKERTDLTMVVEVGGPLNGGGAGLTRFDWEIIEFVMRWQPYGGPREEDAMPLFGMTCARLAERFNELVAIALHARRTPTTIPADHARKQPPRPVPLQAARIAQPPSGQSPPREGHRPAPAALETRFSTVAVDPRQL